MPKHQYSRAVLDREITVHSEHARMLLTQQYGFRQIAAAMYAIDAIVPLIADEQEVEEVERIVSERILDMIAALKQEKSRLEELFTESGLRETPRYTNPEAFKVHITSPRVAQYVNLIVLLDETMHYLDALWLAAVLDNRQKADGAREWRRKVAKMGRSIMEIKRRADGARRKAELPAPEIDGDRPDDGPQSCAEGDTDGEIVGADALPSLPSEGDTQVQLEPAGNPVADPETEAPKRSTRARRTNAGAEPAAAESGEEDAAA